MFKPNNKKMLTVLMAVAMVFSAFAVLSIAAQPAYAASGTFSVNPTTYTEGSASGVSTIAYVSGGTFGAGSTVYFFLSTSTSSSGIVSGSGTTISTVSNTIGSVTLAAGSTSLANVVTFTMSSGAAPGNYYILAEDYISGAPSGTYALGPAVTIVKAVPTVSIASTVTVGSSQQVTGSEFDPGASVTIYLNYPGSSVVLGTTTASSSGAIDTFVTIPALAQGSYYIVAQETNALSAAFPEGGITADTSFTVKPAITVSPVSTSGAAGSSFVITGSGFAAGDSIGASTTSTVTSNITIGSEDTYHPAVTVASDGSFTVSVTLAKAITGSAKVGPVYVNITGLSSPATTAVAFPHEVYVSSPNPTILGFSFTPSSDIPGASVSAAVWNFPAGTPVSIYLGPFLVGTVVTDSNGFGELPSTAVIPAMPAGSYYAYAETSSGLYASPISTTISAYFEVKDPSGALMTSSYDEYFPSNGTYTVSAFGLTPGTSYTWSDTEADLPTSSPSVVSVAVGSYSSGEFMPAANGTLIFTYAPGFVTPSSPATSTLSLSYTSGSVPGLDNLTFEYTTITVVNVTSPGYLANDGAGTGDLTFTETGFLAPGDNLYPGFTYKYNVYIGNTELTIGGVTAITTDTLASSDTFTNPVLPSGVYDLSVVYNGQPVSNAIFSEPVIISASASTLSAGSIVLVPNSASSEYDIVGFGFDSAASVTAYYMTSSGLNTAKPSTITPSFGAFVATTSISIPPYGVAGTYAVFATATLLSSTYTAYTSYTVTPSLSISSSTGSIGTSINVTATGLGADEYYNVYFAGQFEGTTSSDSSGNASATITVPLILPGTYNVSIAPVSSPTSIIASAQFTVSQPSSLSLGSDQFTAFPGELVNFHWTPATEPPLTSTTPIYVTVYLNGSAYETVLGTFTYVSASSSYITGSFKMPNGVPNTLYAVSLGWSTTSVSGSAVSSGSVLTLSPSTYKGKTIAALELVNGTGASIVSISNASIAHIITSSINSALAVPLSELSANITALHGDIVTITTAFGTMTSTLQAINATIKSIESGQALIKTELGTISTTLSSINASIVSLNNNVVTINTTLGKVVTSLSSINATVTSTASGVSSLQGNVVTIITDLGTFTGTVKSVSGGLATIQTSLGNLTMNVSQIKTNTGKINTISSSLGTTEIFEIVILVLVLITLVLSFLAINAANRVAKKVEEQKKQ
ncbi:MAG: hypothetical protein QXU98_07440 [Candidatus Parvarchaeota archaeon]